MTSSITSLPDDGVIDGGVLNKEQAALIATEAPVQETVAQMNASLARLQLVPDGWAASPERVQELVIEDLTWGWTGTFKVARERLPRTTMNAVLTVYVTELLQDRDAALFLIGDDRIGDWDNAQLMENIGADGAPQATMTHFKDVFNSNPGNEATAVADWLADYCDFAIKWAAARSEHYRKQAELRREDPVTESKD